MNRLRAGLALFGRVSPSMRISIGLTGLTMSALFAAHSLGLIPNAERAVLEGRKSLCEAVALECCLAAKENDVTTMRAVTSALVERNPAVLSAAVRRADGKLLAEAARATGADAADQAASPVELPIFQGQKRWGTVAITFRPVPAGVLGAWTKACALRMILFVSGVSLLGYTWYLKKTLRHLDPSSVIPDRVRATLDTLAEGVLVLDKDERIVLANKAFARNTGRTAEELQGVNASGIRWSQAPAGQASPEHPWERAVREGVSQTGAMLRITSATEGDRTFMVNTMPILAGDGSRRGALATFDDVTPIEERNVLLEEMLQVVKTSRDEIRRQNEELVLLATRDPLTSCLNRRAFFSQFETDWNAAGILGQPLSCLMVDIDHFKSVNDQFGHNVGDQVLQQVAAQMSAEVRDRGLVARYGGEEFCVLLPRMALDESSAVAERLRMLIATAQFANLSITISAGVSTMGLGARQPQELLEQADKALYASKRNGRNRVTRWSDLPRDFEIERGPSEGAAPVRGADADVAIPFHAVTALTSALGYRDALTAEHSRRVADLCVATARGLMSERDCYVLEVAALLHDIGKLGVPDAILLKPGSLTDDEWKVMSTHDRIGVEIIMAAFSSEELADIVRTHHAWYGGNPRDPVLPSGDAIPLRARILTIADAFDAMVSDRVYRKGRSRGDAILELRKFAGQQFDPGLVERFIEVVSSSDQTRDTPALAVSKQTALRVGTQIERLASALDARDFPALSVMAGRLAATATKEGVPPLADLAEQLQRAAASDPDLVTIVGLTTDLLELCRSTQSSYLASLGRDHQG